MTPLDSLVLVHYQIWLAFTCAPWIPSAPRYKHVQRYFVTRGLWPRQG